MLPALSDFLRDTFADTVKKLLQPASFIAAFVFLLLNMVFVFPALSESKLSAATSLLRLDPLWQIVLLIVALLMLSHFLFSINRTIFSLATGDLWSDSLFIGPFFIRWQKFKIRWIKTSGQTTGLRMRDYSDEEKDLAPTHLGNVMSSAYADIRKRYDIEPSAFWPHMEIILAGKEGQVMSRRIDNEKSTLDFLLALAFVLLAFAAEYAFLQPWLRTPGTVWWLLTFLTISFGIYRTAIDRARSLGDSVKMAFDLHRDELRQALHLRDYTNAEEERALWRDAALLLQGPVIRGQYDHIFASSPPTSPVSVTTSANVQVTIQDVTVDLWELNTNNGLMADLDQSNFVQTAYKRPISAHSIALDRFIEYVLTVSSISSEHSAAPANGIYLNVIDSRIPKIRQEPMLLDPKPVTPTTPEVVVLPSGQPEMEHRLLWYITGLPANGALVLRYRLYKETLFEANTNHLGLMMELAGPPFEQKAKQPGQTLYEYRFDLNKTSNNNQAEHLLYVYDHRVLLPDPGPEALLILKPTLAHNVSSAPGRINPERVFSTPGHIPGYCWKLDKLADNSLTTLTFTIQTK